MADAKSYSEKLVILAAHLIQTITVLELMEIIFMNPLFPPMGIDLFCILGSTLRCTLLENSLLMLKPERVQY